MAHQNLLCRAVIAAAAAAALAGAGCKSTQYIEPTGSDKDYARELPPGMKGLRKIDPSQYPNFADGFKDRDGMLEALDQSAAYLARPSAQGFFPYLDVPHDRAESSIFTFRRDLSEAKDGADLDKRIREKYEVYESVGWNMKGDVLFTAYHEPIYEGSLTQTGKFKYPIYRRPQELETDDTGDVAYWVSADGTKKPAPTRAALGPMLKGRGLELVYLADPFDAYVVQVQGSARFHLQDGRELRVGYAGDNGQEYKPIWQPLVTAGKIKKDEVSLRRMREYFKAHPGEVAAAIDSNPRFVFFTERQGPAVGCLNVPVTPWHSIATDRNRKDDVFPRAGVAFVKTKIPPRPGSSAAEFAGFVCDQDRGGAIRSAGRADLFLGTGEQAEQLAGQTKAEGRLYYIFLKPQFVSAAVAELNASKAKAKPAAANKKTTEPTPMKTNKTKQPGVSKP
jgi:membrane-bound lytic murein transglycosylase A